MSAFRPSPAGPAPPRPRRDPASSPGNRTAFHVLLLADGLLALGFALDHALGHPFPQLHRWLDLDGEGTLNAWWSGAKLLALAVAFGGFAWARRRHEDRSAWIPGLVGAIFLLLSIDETLQIHEYIGYQMMPVEARGASGFAITGIWGFVLGPLLLGTLAGLGWAARGYLAHLRPIGGRLALGLVVFVVSAAGLDELANLFRYGSAAYEGEVLLEEIGEQAGLSVLLWAALDFARAHGFRAGFVPVPVPVPVPTPDAAESVARARATAGPARSDA